MKDSGLRTSDGSLPIGNQAAMFFARRILSTPFALRPPIRVIAPLSARRRAQARLAAGWPLVSQISTTSLRPLIPP